jgi:hypothetical protein
MHTEASAISGKDNTKYHQAGFDEHGPLADQTERGKVPTGPGIVDIVDTERHGRIRSARCWRGDPAPLPSEYI